MIGIVNHGIKEVFIYINNDQTKEKILPIIKKNVFSSNRWVINNNDVDEYFPTTRIYIDCFLIYQEIDFNRLGYIL